MLDNDFFFCTHQILSFLISRTTKKELTQLTCGGRFFVWSSCQFFFLAFLLFLHLHVCLYVFFFFTLALSSFGLVRLSHYRSKPRKLTARSSEVLKCLPIYRYPHARAQHQPLFSPSRSNYTFLERRQGNHNSAEGYQSIPCWQLTTAQNIETSPIPALTPDLHSNASVVPCRVFHVCLKLSLVNHIWAKLLKH